MDNRETFTHNNFLKVLNYIIVGLQLRMFYRECLCFWANAKVFPLYKISRKQYYGHLWDQQ